MGKHENIEAAFAALLSPPPLLYVTDAADGIRRVNADAYRGPDGKRVRDKATLFRIRKLAIPPAWTDVWICPDPNGHIQATGRDARGRKQYRYHSGWSEARDLEKFSRIIGFARSLPRIRARVEKDMSQRGASRQKALATVVALLDRTLIRVGNEEYARTNGSYGLTTLLTRHVEIAGSELRFDFKGKSGKVWRLRVKDRRIARIARQIQELPGQQLFKYRGDDGEPRAIDSGDVNDYLREIAGPDVSAKDFRTWSGTVLAAAALAAIGPAETKTAAEKNIRQAIKLVATRLGNTPAVCRKCYIHPEIFSAYREGALPPLASADLDPEDILDPEAVSLPREDKVILRFLERRLASGCQ